MAKIALERETPARRIGDQDSSPARCLGKCGRFELGDHDLRRVRAFRFTPGDTAALELGAVRGE